MITELVDYSCRVAVSSPVIRQPNQVACEEHDCLSGAVLRQAHQQPTLPRGLLPQDHRQLRTRWLPSECW